MKVPTMTKRTADRVQRLLTVMAPAVLGLGVMFLSDLSAVLYVFIPFGVVACVWALYYRSANVVASAIAGIVAMTVVMAFVAPAHAHDPHNPDHSHDDTEAGPNRLSDDEQTAAIIVASAAGSALAGPPGAMVSALAALGIARLIDSEGSRHPGGGSRSHINRHRVVAINRMPGLPGGDHQLRAHRPL